MTRMNTRFFILLVVFSAALQCAAQMTLLVSSFPQLTPLRDTLYVAGEFNGWNERDPQYMMTSGPNGHSVVISGLSAGEYEYKITRGRWAAVEGTATGGFVGNRTLNFQNGATENISIAGWEDIAGTPTITSHVRVLDSNFQIPQLNRLRRIWICFPPDYFTTENYYPVVYMHDGQNVFNAGTSFSGEWEVDEAMQNAVQQACSSAIVVAIDNGGGNRLDEYAPWLNTQYNEGGQGGQYVDFIVNTLKPYIDAEFRTLPQKENTAIMGSSLGGLISAYAIFTHPEVFGRAGIFSSAYWFNPQIFDLAASHTAGAGNKIYHVCGTSEGNGSVLTNQNDMIATLEGNGYSADQLIGLDDPNGAHSEWFWREEFPAAYTWLIDCAVLDLSEISPSNFRLFPNPADSVVEIEAEEKIISYTILRQNGQLVQSTNTILPNKKIQAPIENLLSGSYFVVLHLESGKRITLRLIKK